MNELRLNVGAGQTFIPGFTNIDISERAEIQVDLGRESLPFETSSVDMVFSYHTLEHIDDYLFALGEVHRVLRHGGRFLLGVPYVTLTEYNLVNPYHRQNFNEYSFDFFDPARLKGTAAEENPSFSGRSSTVCTTSAHFMSFHRHCGHGAGATCSTWCGRSISDLWPSKTRHARPRLQRLCVGR